MLAGVTKISSTTSTVAHVVLPRPVRISTFPFRNPLFEIDSRGRIAGAVLKQDVARGGAEVYGLQFAVCAKAPCARQPRQLTEYYSSHGGFGKKHATLPAGRYLLFVVSDGVPTTVHLHLPGLGGRATVQPDAAPNVSLETMTPLTPTAPGVPVYRASAEGSIKHVGLTVAAVELRSDKDIGDKVDACTERVNESLPLSPDWCAGSGGGVLMTSRGKDDHRALIVAAALAGRGSYRHWISVETASLVKDINGVALTLDYGSGRRSGGMSTMAWYDN